MSILYDCCCCPGVTVTATASAPSGTIVPINPLLYYDKALGTPTAQGISPPYPTLSALCYEVNGAGPMYAWNPGSLTWY